jgi:hypothetical protein
MHTNLRIHRFAQQQLRRLRASLSLRRTRAAADRLLRSLRRGACAVPLRAASRFTPIERVMRRCAVRVVAARGVSANLTLHAWLRAGISVPELPAGTAPTLRSGRAARAPRPMLRERVTVVQRSLHEHLLERLAVATASASAPAVRAATVARIEHRTVYPRVPAMQIRAAVVATAAARIGAQVPEAPRVAPLPGLSTDARRAVPDAAPVLAPQELSRVTDHVIHQLDRRVLSYLERTGRN